MLSREIDRLVDRICAGTDSEAINNRLRALEREKADLAAELAELERAAEPVALRPGAAYTRAIEQLGATLANDVRTGEAAQLIRRLEDHIDVIPATERGQFELTACGGLAELTAITTAKTIREK